MSPTPTWIERGRALRALRDRMYARTTIVTAPAGYGKSALLREVASGDDGIFVEVREGATFARFSNDLVSATARLVPRLERSFAGAFSRASQSDDPPRTLALWFTKQIAQSRARFVIDGLDRARGAVVGTFLQRAIEASDDTLSWLVSTRHLDTFSASSLLAFGYAALPLDENDLRLRPEELEALAATMGHGVGRSDLRVIGAKAAGSVSRAHFLLAAYANGDAGIADPAVAFERTCEGIFTRLGVEEHRALLTQTLVPASDAQIADDPVLERLRAEAPHLFEGRRLHESFGRWLRTKFDELDAASKERLLFSMADELERGGDVHGALTLLGRATDEAPILRCIERHATNALEREHLHFLHDAVAGLCAETRRTHPIVLAFLAMEASLENQVDLAESLFQNALASAREAGAARQAQCIRYWYAVELVRRDRSDAIALLKPDVEFFEARPRLRVAMMSTLGVAYAKNGQADRGKRWVERALHSVAQVSDDALRALVHHQASYIALCADDGPEARRLAECALLYAESVGAAQIATAASSVLYAAAMDIEGDLEDAVVQLHRLSGYAARAGNVSGQLYALAAIFEVETDRGNVAALAAVERELDVFDVQYGAALESETIVPAQAMQHAWRGEFGRAFRILEGSDEQQFSNDRKALRLAEIAVYAAAAGFDRAASESVTKALGLMHGDESDLRTLRARGFAALALVALGRTREARGVVRALAEAAEPRSRSAAFGEAVAILADRREGARNARELSAALEEVRRLEWGGLARIVGALPAGVVSVLSSDVSGARLVS